MKVMVRIQALVDARGWDMQELAHQVEVDAETARNLYDGRSTELDLEGVGLLSHVLGVLPNDIVASVEEKQPSAADAPAPRDPHLPTAPDAAPATPGAASEGKLDALDAQQPINVAGQQIGYFPQSSEEPGIQMPHIGPDRDSVASEDPAIQQEYPAITSDDADANSP